MIRPLHATRWLTPCLLLLSSASLLLPASARAAEPSGQVMVYVGTYTGPSKGKGVYLLRMDPATGKLSEPEVAGEVANPSFIAISPNHRFLYAAGEVDSFRGAKAGAVSAFAIDPASGKLTLLNQQTSGGQGPCYVAVDDTGRVALVANFTGGSVESLPVGEDGRLGEPATFIQHTGKGPDPRRQESPHAHCFDPAPGDRFALACDLGLDKVMVYRLDHATAKLTPNDPPSASVPPGAGPRHIAFHPSGRFVYVINEMGSSVTHFTWDADKGVLRPMQTVSTLPAGLKVGNNTCAEVMVHPSGKFLYGSNRGHDSIAIFRINEQTGALTPAGHQSTEGKTPRNFGIDPTGTWLIAANQDSGSLVVFKIDPNTGGLTPNGVKVNVPSAVCVKFLAAGK
jgi:6-phosphogluconolactonase